MSSLPCSSRASLCFGYCRILNSLIPYPHSPLSLASFILLEEDWEAATGMCGGRAACRPLEISQRKNCPSSGPQPWLLATSASQLLEHLVPCLCPGAGRAPPPWLSFPAWKPESLLQLGNRESCAGPWLGGKSRMGRLAAGCMRHWQGCMCCAIVCYLSGSCKNKCLEFDSVCQDPLSFLHLDFLNRSCFSLD